MPPPGIANPILNSPFSEPERHFPFNDEGITDQIANGRRPEHREGRAADVRPPHAYFTDADEPYEKLKRALKAEIDEAAWATLYSKSAGRSRSQRQGRLPSK